MRALAPLVASLLAVVACKSIPESPPAAAPGGTTGSAGRLAAFGYAQHGQACSPIDGYADEYELTRLDEGCAQATGNDRLVVSFWGRRSSDGHRLQIASPEDGDILMCAGKGECVRGRDAELTFSEARDGGHPSHLRAHLADGRLVESDFVLRECPEHRQFCG